MLRSSTKEERLKGYLAAGDLGIISLIRALYLCNALLTCAPTALTAGDVAAIDAPIVKMEPDPTAASLACPPSSRWMRRKNVMRLKIDGIAVHQRKRRPVRASHTEPGARLLEMFSELMDSRMESCQRVQRLVRNANRADLYMR